MTAWTPDQPILEIENLSISFATRLRDIPAVMDFSLRLMAGEAMGLVGESGCGKSTVALGIMRDLGRTGRIAGGRILFKGQDLATMSEADGAREEVVEKEEGPTDTLRSMRDEETEAASNGN